jgi:rSAM/selenodomain-associated transferase 2
LLLCLPTLHPWYLALVAPFAAAAASPAWILLQAGVVMTVPVMAVERATGVFQEIHWLKFFEYGFFFGWLAVAAVRPRGRPGPVFSGVRDLAVVIPALNESWHIERCLESLRASGGIARVVVSDGGSSDETRAVARRNGAAVVRCPPGRGRQIRCGVRQTTEDAVMVVHADCRLEPDTVESVLRALNTDRRTAGGAVGMRFFPADRRKRLLSALNNLRSRLTGISFGDQCQFFRRAALDRAGGFPDLMLMEDVELSLRLRGQGRLAFLPHGVRVSGRRWDRIGFASGVWKVLYLFAAYLTCRRLDTVDPHADFFYRRYYDRGVGIE